MLRTIVTTTTVKSSMRLILPYVVLQSRRTFMQTIVNRSTLIPSINELNVKDLRDECRKRGLKVSGRKLELQERIQTFESDASNHVLNDVKSQLDEAQLHVERLESQINTVNDEVAHHGGAKLGQQHLEEDSYEVGSMVDELKQVQKQLNLLKTHARVMNKDVESIIDKDGGDITYTPLPGEKVETPVVTMSNADVPGVDILKHELDAARTQAERLQAKVDFELQAAIDAAATTSITSTTPESSSSPTEQKQMRNGGGKKYLLSVLGATLGLGWIFQDSLIRKEPLADVEDVELATSTD